MFNLAQLSDLDILQRKLLRSLVGWVICTDDTWKEAGHKMKLRLEAALALYPIEPSSTQLASRRNRLCNRLSAPVCPSWTHLAHSWHPKAPEVLNGMQCFRRVGSGISTRPAAITTTSTTPLAPATGSCPLARLLHATRCRPSGNPPHPYLTPTLPQFDRTDDRWPADLDLPGGCGPYTSLRVS